MIKANSEPSYYLQAVWGVQRGEVGRLTEVEDLCCVLGPPAESKG